MLATSLPPPAHLLSYSPPSTRVSPAEREGCARLTRMEGMERVERCSEGTRTRVSDMRGTRLTPSQPLDQEGTCLAYDAS